MSNHRDQLNRILHHFEFRILFCFAGSILLFFGIWICLTWTIDQPYLIQIDFRYSPPHYNAGFGLVGWGIGLIGLARGCKRIVRISGWSLIGFNLLLLLAQWGIIPFDWKNWLFEPQSHLYALETDFRTQLTAILILMSGISLLLNLKSTLRIIDWGFLGFLGLLSLWDALPNLFGIAFSPSTGIPNNPAILTALSQVVGGLVLLYFVIRSHATPILGYSLPILLGLSGCIFSIIIWRGLNIDQRERLQRMVQFEAAVVQRTVVESAITQSIPFGSFVKDIRDPQLLEKDLDQAASGLFITYPSAFAFARIDRDMKIEWIKQHGSWVFPMYLDEFGIQEELSEAFHAGTIFVTQSLNPIRQDQSILFVYVPKEEQNPDLGGFLILFNSNTYFSSILNANIAPGYAVSLIEGDHVLFSRFANQTQFRDKYEQSLPIDFERMRWKLSIWPTEELVSTENIVLPRLALGFGFLTTILLALGVYFAQIAWSRTRNLEREISDRRQAEEALRMSETRYRCLLENLEHGVALKDSFGRYLAINKVFGEQIGRTSEEIIGKTDDELFPEALAQRLNIEQQNILMEDKKYEIEEELELCGTKRLIRRISTPQREGDQSIGVLSIWWDVTEQRKIESCLAQAGKIEAIGQLAGGIAHDFNNLLTAIIGNLDLVINGSKAGKLELDCLSAARTAALRGSSLTNRLLGFSRRHQLNWIPCDLNAIVDEVYQLLQRTVDPRIELQIDQCHKIWHVQADPGQMNQVLMNLCLNARDAIVGSGTIRIETSCMHLKEVKQFGHPDATPGYYVRLRVTDSGCGMTSEVRAHIFEPFFTTKEVGKGTGLGLAMVFGIVKQHKGWIECNSEVNRGTQFDIYLPRTDSVLYESAVSTPRPLSFTPSSQTILIVDDEAMLRQMVSRVLKKEGFVILEAEDGQEAVEIYQREHHHIDLVILDLTMPRLSGQDAFRILRQLNPDVKVLFTSGYAEEQISLQEKESIMGFIEKPYRLTEVVRTIQEIFQTSTA